MEARSVQRFVRISPKKCRLVADMIRGLPVEQASDVLRFTTKKAARQIKAVLDNAIANADQNKQIDVDALFVKSIMVDQGPVLKRFMSRSMGRANRIRKPTSHISIVLGEK